jgi:DNA-directed RNA polymerase specialized sigma24 family protein
VGTVKSRLSRGRERLAGLLDAEPSEPKEERHARP